MDATPDRRGRNEQTHKSIFALRDGLKLSKRWWFLLTFQDARCSIHHPPGFRLESANIPPPPTTSPLHLTPRRCFYSFVCAGTSVNVCVCVHFCSQLPYAEDSEITYQAIGNLRADKDVKDLRDTYGADLVQMIGSFNDGFCGRGYVEQQTKYTTLQASEELGKRAMITCFFLRCLRILQ